MVKYEEFKESIGKVVQPKNSFDYILSKVEGNYALLEVKGTNSSPRCFEVWKLRTFSKEDKYNPEGVRFPSNNEFGTYGWCYTHKEDAMVRFNQLVGK